MQQVESIATKVSHTTEKQKETSQKDGNESKLDIFALRKNVISYTRDQETALREIAAFLSNDKGAIYILAGYAGTGKTTIAENIINYAQDLHKECLVTAPTNQAVKVIKDKLEDINVAFKTLHSILYGCPDPDTGQWIPSVSFKPGHVVLVDEASMLSRTVYDDLRQAIHAAKAKVIFVGDSFQLEPVGDDSKILQYKNFELTQVKRQGAGSEILSLATCLRSLKQTVIPTESCGNVRIAEKQTVARAFLLSVLHNENSIFIVGTNKARLVLNKKARQVKFGEKVTDMPQNGDRLLFIGNGTVFVNGDKMILDQAVVIGTTLLPIKEAGKKFPAAVKAYLLMNGKHKIVFLPSVEKSSVYHGQFVNADKKFPEDWCEKNINTHKYELSKEVSIATYGYVVTAHKSQGSQWEKVFVHQDAFRDNPRWLYTAITRAEKELTVTGESSANKRTWEQIIKIANRT